MYYNPIDPTDPIGSYCYGQHEPGDDYDENAAIRRALHAIGLQMLVMVIVVAVCALLGACTTPKTTIVERVTHDTVQVTRLQHDSIYRHDSIYIREHQSGDTVFLEVTRWHTAFRDRRHHDSIYISRRDTVPVPYPVEKRVPVQLNTWQQLRIWLGNIVLVALAVLAAVWLLKKRTWWLRLIK